MAQLAEGIGRFVATVLVAHALAYALVCALPAIGVAVFGLGAADQTVLSQFRERVDAPVSYWDALYRVFAGNWGRTLDGASVAHSLYSSFSNSLPPLAISLAVLVLSIVLALQFPRMLAQMGASYTAGFLGFIPAYLPGFLLLAGTTLLGGVLLFEDSGLRDLALGVAIGLTPAAIAAATVSNAYRLELQLPYVTYMRACGLPEKVLYRNSSKAVLLYVLPGWEKLVSLQITILIFTEAIISYPGFGSFFLLSVQRTDVNVILVSVSLISMTVAAFRLLSALINALLEPPGLDTLNA